MSEITLYGTKEMWVLAKHMHQVRDSSNNYSRAKWHMKCTNVRRGTRIILAACLRSAKDSWEDLASIPLGCNHARPWMTLEFK